MTHDLFTNPIVDDGVLVALDLGFDFDSGGLGEGFFGEEGFAEAWFL